MTDPLLNGTGWLPDPPPTDAEREASRAHVARLGAAPIPRSGGVARAPWYLNQRGESCTGHTGVGALYGLTGFRASPYMTWAEARLTQYPGVAPLPNVGVSTYAFLRAFEKHGAPAWSDWNPDTTPNFSIERPAPVLVRLRAQKHRLRLNPIWEGGHSALQAVLAALAAGSPVGIVVNADDAFRNPVNGRVGAEVDSDAPQHIVTGWTYQTLDSGEREVYIVNSWGTGYGLGGGAWVPESRIMGSPFLCTAEVLP